MSNSVTVISAGTVFVVSYIEDNGHPNVIMATREDAEAYVGAKNADDYEITPWQLSAVEGVVHV